MDNVAEGVQEEAIDYDKLPLEARIKNYEDRIKECLDTPELQEHGSFEPSFTDPDEFAQQLFSNLREMHGELCNCHQRMVDEGFFKPGQELWTDWIRSATKIQTYLPEDDKVKMSIMLARAYCNRGIMKYMLVDFEGAISDYTEAMKHDAALPELYYNRGMILYRLAFFKQACADTEEAIRLEPENKEYKSWLEHIKEMKESPTGHDFELPLVGYGETD